MKLPEKGSVVPLETIREICMAYGLDALWEKIEKDPPSLPFQSDGCSIARILNDTRMAEIMFQGVRVGGHPVIKQSFSWGFGRR